MPIIDELTQAIMAGWVASGMLRREYRWKPLEWEFHVLEYTVTTVEMKLEGPSHADHL